MAELQRKNEDLTTADLAARSEEKNKITRDVRETDPARPIPVRSESSNIRQRENVSPAVQSPAVQSPAAQEDIASAHLFSETDIGDLRGRWGNVQAGFVDEPRRAVEEADKLVAAVMERLAKGFADERANLEKQWDRGDNVSTEDLRVALRRYRTFFDRLLNA